MSTMSRIHELLVPKNIKARIIRSLLEDSNVQPRCPHCGKNTAVTTKEDLERRKKAVLAIDFTK